MRWFARPNNNAHQLRVTPRLAAYNKADYPDQVRLRAYLDDIEALLADSQIDRPWALRLDVGLPVGRNLLNMADLDNYAYPLANRLKDPGLVSVWCTKQHSDQSFVRIDAARQLRPQRTDVVVVRTPSATNYKERITAAVADAVQLPPGPVRLELSFVVGPRRNWLVLWKPTIDALEPLLGRDPAGKRPWHPCDGRITELGMHLTVDPAFGSEIEVGIDAAPLDVPVNAAKEPHVSTSHDHCPVCGERINIYDSTACEDESGQTWCIAHLPDDHPQTSLNMHLSDGRNITIDEIKILESTAGIYIGSPQRIWDEVVHERATPPWDPVRGLPTFVIPPVSRRSDIPVLPRWEVHATLTSAPMGPLTYFPTGNGSGFTLGGGSHLMLVFFCNDIASRPITALIGDRLAHLDEKTWRERAQDFENS